MKKILILSLTILATGCSMMPQQTRPVEVVTIAEPPPMYHPPLPLELQLVDIDWEILTPELTLIKSKAKIILKTKNKKKRITDC